MQAMELLELRELLGSLQLGSLQLVFPLQVQRGHQPACLYLVPARQVCLPGVQLLQEVLESQEVLRSDQPEVLPRGILPEVLMVVGRASSDQVFEGERSNRSANSVEVSALVCR